MFAHFNLTVPCVCLGPESSLNDLLFLSTPAPHIHYNCSIVVNLTQVLSPIMLSTFILTVFMKRTVVIPVSDLICFSDRCCVFQLCRGQVETGFEGVSDASEFIKQRRCN